MIQYVDEERLTICTGAVGPSDGRSDRLFFVYYLLLSTFGLQRLSNQEI